MGILLVLLFVLFGSLVSYLVICYFIEGSKKTRGRSTVSGRQPKASQKNKLGPSEISFIDNQASDWIETGMSWLEQKSPSDLFLQSELRANREEESGRGKRGEHNKDQEHLRKRLKVVAAIASTPTGLVSVNTAMQLHQSSNVRNVKDFEKVDADAGAKEIKHTGRPPTPVDPAPRYV